jgi:hypothetical protein
MNVLADDNARRRVVRELRIVREAERFEESSRSREISDGQIDEDLLVHGLGHEKTRAEAPVRSRKRRTSFPAEDNKDKDF